jgi:hypothetical protein
MIEVAGWRGGSEPQQPCIAKPPLEDKPPNPSAHLRAGPEVAHRHPRRRRPRPRQDGGVVVRQHQPRPPGVGADFTPHDLAGREPRLGSLDGAGAAEAGAALWQRLGLRLLRPRVRARGAHVGGDAGGRGGQLGGRRLRRGLRVEGVGDADDEAVLRQLRAGVG